ncbi:MAG: FlgD immunoglobulin-like domain containing protein, partial [Candidatus Margulisiibacteriota bacterium]
MRKYVLILLLSIFVAPATIASNIEGTSTYKDYLFILVHGINGGSHHFNGQDNIDKDLRLLQHLETDLGLQGHVYAYSFKNKNGGSQFNAREFGDRTYKNTATYINSNGDKNVPMDGKCWLEKARQDFIKWFKSNENNIANPGHRDPRPEEIPSKYIIVAHSMGNMAVRLYVYSPFMKGLWQECFPGDTSIQNGFYKDDIAKVVFVGPPFTGSDLAYPAVVPKVAFQSWLVYDKLINSESVMNKLIMNIMANNYSFLSDPYAPYKITKEFSFLVMDYPMFIDNLYGLLGVNPDWQPVRQMDPIEGGGYGALDVGTWQLMPEIWFEGFNELLSSKYEDPNIEPAYSVIYGLGGPVLNINDAVKNKLITMYLGNRADAYDSVFSSSNYVKNLSMTNSDMTSAFSMSEIFNNFGNEISLLMPGSGFYSLSTAQAKFVSLVLSNNALNLTEDGDCAVPVHSAKGLYEEKITGKMHSTKHLQDAKFYERVYKGKFNDFLENEFPDYLVGAGVAYAGMRFAGMPHETALQIVQWPLALLVIGKVIENKNDIWYNHFAHTNSLLKEYSLIENAILDTPAIFTVKDLQTTAEAQGSPEAGVMLFSVSSPEAGYRSITVRGLSENRNYSGLVNMAVPATLKTTGEGERKYVKSMTVTEPPTRVVGKLNYLIPSRIKQFEYSFNFADWKPIENVNPETGEFVLENLPFAEGQNVIAVRAENAVGIKSHQLIKIVLNTIPMVPSNLSPLPGTYTNNKQPTWSGEFGKAGYSEQPIEDIAIQRAIRINPDGTEVDITGQVQVEITGGTYDKHLKYRYTPDGPLSDGRYTLIVTVTSNVGVSQSVSDLTIDTQSPTLAIQPLPPYSPRAPTTIRYSASDEASPNLVSVRCELYNQNNELVTTIATADSLSKGENFFNWDGQRVSDGTYIIKIKAFDLAGNYAVAEQPITVDATSPMVTGVDISPNPMTSKTTELGLTARVNEKSTVVIKMNNLSNNTTTAYLAQSSVVASAASESLVVSYLWKYDDMFQKGPEDGIYNVEVIARDEAGNESLPRTLEAVRIDRTPPVIYGQITNPYVLSNIGKNAYKTTLSYDLSDAESAKIKIYNSNTGTLVDTIPAAPAARGSNAISWNANSANFPKGAYRFQIIATDDVGNEGVAYASCVKDGIAPEISYPAEDNTEVSGTISIRGTAIDPDWTNDKPFKDYRVSYKKAGEDWKSDFIEVPQVNRAPNDPKNISVRPLQNNSTLAYLYTNNLENGDYTIKVEVNEENGESLAAERTIKVNNDSMTASAVQTPYVKLKTLPSSIDFKSDDSVKLPIGFLNSVKPANVYVEIIRPSPRSGPCLPAGREGGPRASEASREVDEVVFFKYFPNILGAPFIGKPAYKPGTDLGYFFWGDEDGYHIRWSADGSNHKFTGSIVAVGGSFNTPSPSGRGGEGVRATGNLISWDSSISGGEGGIDFKITSGQLMITPKIDEDPASPSITADNVYLGVSKFTQAYLPIIIDVTGQKLVDVTNMGKSSAASNLERPTQTVEWDGKYATGAFVDNGSYLVRV